MASAAAAALGSGVANNLQPECPKHCSKQLSEELSNLFWGSEVKEEVFLRWTQGFEFSKDEATALLLLNGGPCAVITSVQAFLVKNVLFLEAEGSAGGCKLSSHDELNHIDGQARERLLIQALVDILKQAAGENFVLVWYENCAVDGRQQAIVHHTDFHNSIRLEKLNSVKDVCAAYQRNLDKLHSMFGVLTFVYSVVLTKGVEALRREHTDPNQSLVDALHGYACQSLINLLVSGRAVANVFDNDQDLGGLKLQGISKQSTIGFLTIHESQKYCEVGSFLKNPRFPIWVLGSETHLTVLFSMDCSLVSEEGAGSTARRVLKTRDTEGAGFIMAEALEAVMLELELVSDQEYVAVMKKELDPEGTGVIMTKRFMEEFFPNEPALKLPDTFVVYHCNGLNQSNLDGKVVYRLGNACLLESEIQVTDGSSMTSCLQTKWPTIEVNWSGGHAPSLN